MTGLKLERKGFSFSEAVVNWRLETHLGDENFMKDQTVIFDAGQSEHDITFDLPLRPQNAKSGKYKFSITDLQGDAVIGDDFDSLLGSLEANVNNDIQVKFLNMFAIHFSIKKNFLI